MSTKTNELQNSINSLKEELNLLEREFKTYNAHSLPVTETVDSLIDSAISELNGTPQKISFNAYFVQIKLISPEANHFT